MLKIIRLFCLSPLFKGIKYFFSFVFVLVSLAFSNGIQAQNIPANMEVIEEYFRRSQLMGTEQTSRHSFLLRPMTIADSLFPQNLRYGLPLLNKKHQKYFSPQFKLLPISSSIRFGYGDPYPEVSRFLVAKGFQQYTTAGVYASLGPISIQLQPEFIFSQNLHYGIGFVKSCCTEYVEVFGEGSYSKFLPGQSSLQLNLGFLTLKASTENIWWGPGQWNSLIFSNNAFGFPHLSLLTNRQAKTFLGDFEGQILIGRLEDSGLTDTFVGSHRYLNGLMFSYQPRWIPGFHLGFSRTFQQFEIYKENSFNGTFPIFSPVQKINYGFEEDLSELGNRDQQIAVFTRFLIPTALTEVYAEFGRRDHAYNWREAILNPEHARAYLFGFVKLFRVSDNAYMQVRGEVLQQQESLNIIIRYPGIGGGNNWGGHGTLYQGFTHKGQMLGPGIGPSSNVQTFETAWVKGLKKVGLRLERLNRHQDIYTQRFNDPSEQGRWVDYSARLLADWQWNNLILSGNINFVNSLNHQWQLASDSSPDFPHGKNHFSVHSQVSLIYLWNKKEKL